MNLRTAAALVSAALLAGCSPSTPQKSGDDLVTVDKAFSARSAKDGPRAAFAEYFAEDAKILNQYRTGPAGIQDMFLQLPADATLTWEPASVQVSTDGDLGYTWGRYTLTLPHAGHSGRPFMQMGYYSTVWKRANLGRWKVALEAMIPDGQK
ncbi:MAG TPA: nuclear transport factor 2 family protein [Opitutaceae bacterium]